MRATITGTTLPVLQIELAAGEKVIAGPDQLSWLMGPVEMNTTTSTAGSSGLWGAVTRAISGGGLFMTEFEAKGGAGVVAFAAQIPGTIHEVQVDGGRSYMVHHHGFLCATAGVELGTGVQQSLGAGIFGGEGFVLQKLSGRCTAWVELGGETVIHELQAGQSMLVHPGHIGMFEDSLRFEMTTVRGVKNMMFGGDGLFLARLSGPGTVWLQTLTAPKLAHALAPYMPKAER
ncbi:AIM24 family protein [Corticibacterium sp. UT-5YL-CI-8]|nr:AIM24 family protein [Tianweitania sp. UT-5YL-CI-8]